MNNAILWPALALVGVTFCVWLRMFITRTGYITRNRISLRTIATRAAAQPLLAPVSAAADNLMNLFELPVLFYVLIVLLHQRGAGEAWAVAAWLYVILRAVHSYIHCTYNKVMHRFYAYAASSLVLWGMWLAFALSLCGN